MCVCVCVCVCMCVCIVMMHMHTKSSHIVSAKATLPALNVLMVALEADIFISIPLKNNNRNDSNVDSFDCVLIQLS